MKSREHFTAGVAAPGGHALRRQLQLRDLVLSQILCVVGTSWVGIAAGLGRAQAVVWLSAMLLFYAPMGVAVYFLNREMPLEGGLYAWSRRAFGDALGFMTAWNVGAYALLTIGTLLFEVPTQIAYVLGPRAAWLPENHAVVWSMLGALTAGLAFSSIRGLGLGKWVHNVSGTAMLTVFALLVLTPLLAKLRGQAVPYAPLAMHLPGRDLRSLALMGEMFGALCGLEYIAILAGETRDPVRNIGRSVLWASPAICGMFLFGTGSVLAFHEMHPNVPINYIAPIPQTLRLALGEGGMAQALGSVAILLVTLRVLGAASYIFTGVTRLPMAAGWDRLAPEWLGRLDARRRTPVHSIVLCALLVAAILVLASVGVRAAEAFQVLSNASSEFYALAYVAMFSIALLGPVSLRRKLPRWAAWACAAGLLTTLFSMVVIAYPFVDVVDPRLYAVKIVGTTLLVNLTGYGFYVARRKGQTNASQVETVAGI